MTPTARRDIALMYRYSSRVEVFKRGGRKGGQHSAETKRAQKAAKKLTQPER